MSQQSYKTLTVYQDAKQLVLKVYQLLKLFPLEERFALCDQIRRAVISVPSNIVEGMSRTSNKEKVHFLDIAYASMLEMDSQLDISKDLGFISEEQYNQQKAAILETSNALLETYNEQFQIAQFTMATTSYNALMTEDTNFYNSQLSRNREHTSLMLANDTEYYNGIHTIATETQNTLETNLANFNAGVLSSEDANYIILVQKILKNIEKRQFNYNNPPQKN